MLLGIFGFLGWKYSKLPTAPTQPAQGNSSVNYGVKFGPVYLPNPLPQLLTLEQTRFIIQSVNSSMGNQFPDDMLLAIAKVESGHIADATAKFNRRAYRFEPHLNEASYGLFQTLQSTAKDMGLKGSPLQLYDPFISARIAITYLAWIKNFIQARLGFTPSITQILYAYNGGVGNFIKHQQGTPATRQYAQRYNTALETIQNA